MMGRMQEIRYNAGQITGNQNGHNAVQNVGNQVRQNAGQNPGIQNVRNQNRLIVVLGIANQNENGNVVTAWDEEEAGTQLQAEEFDLMAAAGDIDEIEEVNANCILMANLQQASTSEEQYTELLDPITESLTVKQNNSNVISVESSVEHNGGTIELSAKQITTLHEEIANLNNQLSKEKSIVSLLQEENKKLKSDFKTREDKFLNKQIQYEKKIKELDNILAKMGQSIQTMHMLSPKPDSFYHTEQKMALGYQNPFYLKQAQQKQQNLYNGRVLLEKHNPPAVYGSEETLQLAQESLSKPFSIPTDELSNDTPGVAWKFLNEEADKSLDKITILETKNERLLREVVSQDIMSIVQSPYVVETLDLQTKLERTKERFENCIIKKENEYAKVWNYWYKKCEKCKYDKILYDNAHNNLQHPIERFQAHLGDLKGKSMDIQCASDTLDPLSQKLEYENVSIKFQTSREDKFVPINKARASIRTNPINVSQPHVIYKKDVNSNSNGLSSTGVDNTAKTRRPQPRSNTKIDRVSSTSKSSCASRIKKLK
ncbi:hypothetical protein Tco_1054108 [Tanacetum coccineum]|uniref:Uncharacterized protein n=1 Tax=Tanacetum coccineum TaxID=301880 RepID=A0ABQ5GX30_9ASTR